MFSKLFGPKTKEIKEYKHQIWAKWFTCDAPRPSHIQQLPTEISSIYQQIGETYYTKQQINQDRKVDDEEFFSGLFKLDEELNAKTNDLINFFNNSLPTIPQNDKIFTIIMPPIMQQIIRYFYQFPFVWKIDC